MTTARDNARAAADSRQQPTELHTRSRGGRAIGGQVVRRYRAREPGRCQCCRCRIRGGALVYEVMTAGGDVLEVCEQCAGA